LAEVHERFGRTIGQTRHAEEDLLDARLDGRLRALPKWLGPLIVRKMAGNVLVSVRGAQ
jgi:hypothetical protein